ncbi:MAG: D-alanyl-D-alanine carboxypeptidase [Hyphomicrobiales bacterium]|nr:MAG: D-alanyl-D-alanine carboxypeptidase [Hyphomicrobiales bacterium]
MASQRVIEFSRVTLSRLAAAVIFAVLAFAPVAAQAATAPRAYAGIVVDAKSGKVLYESDADDYRYPASVTKVMTLYVLFQELNSGNIKLSDKMPVSKHAASAVPTKLGLKAGSSISVENAIKALVTLSANDMARVIAEYISGSESAFAKRMTSTAKALGMKHTTYANASGLPDSRQITTVRDQAVLATAVYQHFPKYYEFFQTKSFSYGKRTYGNHNNLLGRNGIDGIKTGYINSSGYNLMTAARADGRHIVVIAFGFNKAASRDAKVRELVQKYMPKGRSGSYLDVAMIPEPGRKAASQAGATVQVASVPVVPMPMPAFRGFVTEDAGSPEFGIGDIDTSIEVAAIAPAPADLPPAVQAVESVAPSPMSRTTLDRVIGDFTDAYLGSPPAALGATRPSAPIVPPVGVGEAGEPIDLMTSGSVTAVAEIPAAQAMPLVTTAPAANGPVASGWIVQIGAAPSENGANTLLSSAAGKVGSLTGFEAFIQRFEKDGQTFFRARFGGFSGKDAANDMCKQLKQAKMSCLAMQS